MVLEDTFVQGYHLPNHQLEDDCVILDLGANVGYTMADFAYRYPFARIIGVELDSDNAQIARRNVQEFGGRCVVVEGAVWHEDGRIVYGGGEEWAFHVVDEIATKTTNIKSAPAFTIQTILAMNGVDKVRYMKMDIEGAEASVLAPNAPWLDRVEEIKVEVHPPATMESCKSVLEQAGFECVKDGRHWACLTAKRKRA
jgi:FkbM family methyltransferase